MTLVGDRERDRALTTLRHRYVSGHLTTEELEERSRLAVVARTKAELRAAQRELPLDLGPLARRVARGAAVGAIATLWLLLSGVLAISLLVAEAIDPGWAPVAVFGLAWALTTVTAWVLARRLRAR